MPNETDTTPRYTPDFVVCRTTNAPVVRRVVHPPGTHAHSPIRNDMTALELVTEHGSRWYGVERGWINSELRMVVCGFNARFEEMCAWSVCNVP